MKSFSRLEFFYLTTLFFIIINSSASSPLHNITCNKNDFRLTIPLIQVNALEVTFFFDISLSSVETLVNANVTFNQYMQACMTNVVIRGVQIKPELDGLFFIEKLLVTNTTVSTFFNQVTTLNPMATYNFSFGYEQKQNFNETLILNSTQINACFGSPGKPLNLRQTLLSDGGVILEWNEPNSIRAPFLCYYLVEKMFFMNTTKVKQNSLYYIVDKSELANRPQVRISTYNEAYC